MFLSILSISNWKDLLSILTKLGPNAATDCPSALSFLLKPGYGGIHLPSQHLGGKFRKVRSSEIALLHNEP